jgi:anaerobic magnesium-protoporphyrin IX monomethyl ester cyclase
MDKKKIVFIYKGRYTVRDTAELESLSAEARQQGFETGLVFDQDVFGITDNVFYAPLLNRLFSNDERTASRIAEMKPDQVVYLDNFNTRAWAEKVIALARDIFPDFRTVIVKPGDVSGNCEPSLLPDKALFEKYVNFSDSYLIYTSRGCPFACTYCEEAVNAAGFTQRSPENVLAELKEGKQRFGFREVIFKDSVFTHDRNWLDRFLSLYKEEIGVPFKCFGKASVFDEKTAGMLKAAGCYNIEFGVQTFNETIRRTALNRGESNAQLLRAFEICDRIGLAYDADHMFGLPGESVADHVEAARIYGSLRMLNRIKCHNLVVYPGSVMSRFKKASTAGDFTSTHSDEPENRLANECFRKIFKVLPLIPARARAAAARNWRLFSFLPKPAVVLGQLAIAAVKKDVRFAVYVKYYPRKILAAAGI